jgi:hypothetical protein
MHCDSAAAAAAPRSELSARATAASVAHRTAALLQQHDEACTAEAQEDGSFVFEAVKTVHVSWPPRTELAVRDVLSAIAKAINRSLGTTSTVGELILATQQTRSNALEFSLANQDHVFLLLNERIDVGKHTLRINSACNPRLCRVTARSIPCEFPIKAIEAFVARYGSVIQPIRAHAETGLHGLRNGTASLVVMLHASPEESTLPTHIAAKSKTGTTYNIVLDFQGQPRACTNCWERGHHLAVCPKTQCFGCKKFGHLSRNCDVRKESATVRAADGRGQKRQKRHPPIVAASQAAKGDKETLSAMSVAVTSAVAARVSTADEPDKAAAVSPQAAADSAGAASATARASAAAAVEADAAQDQALLKVSSSMAAPAAAARPKSHQATAAPSASLRGLVKPPSGNRGRRLSLSMRQQDQLKAAASSLLLSTSHIDIAAAEVTPSVIHVAPQAGQLPQHGLPAVQPDSCQQPLMLSSATSADIDGIFDNLAKLTPEEVAANVRSTFDFGDPSNFDDPFGEPPGPSTQAKQ